MQTEEILQRFIFFGVFFLSLHLFFYPTAILATIVLPLYIYAQVEQVMTVSDLCERLLRTLMGQNIVIIPPIAQNFAA
jgi:putative effector of murein hydrolase LrgA (UPF0299 family)